MDAASVLTSPDSWARHEVQRLGWAADVIGGVRTRLERLCARHASDPTGPLLADLEALLGRAALSSVVDLDATVAALERAGFTLRCGCPVRTCAVPAHADAGAGAGLSACATAARDAGAAADEAALARVLGAHHPRGPEDVTRRRACALLLRGTSGCPSLTAGADGDGTAASARLVVDTVVVDLARAHDFVRAVAAELLFQTRFMHMSERQLEEVGAVWGRRATPPAATGPAAAAAAAAGAPSTSTATSEDVHAHSALPSIEPPSDEAASSGRGDGGAEGGGARAPTLTALLAQANADRDAARIVPPGKLDEARGLKRVLVQKLVAVRTRHQRRLADLEDVDVLEVGVRHQRIPSFRFGVEVRGLLDTDATPRFRWDTVSFETEPVFFAGTMWSLEFRRHLGDTTAPAAASASHASAALAARADEWWEEQSLSRELRGGRSGPSASHAASALRPRPRARPRAAEYLGVYLRRRTAATHDAHVALGDVAGVDERETLEVLFTVRLCGCAATGVAQSAVGRTQSPKTFGHGADSSWGWDTFLNLTQVAEAVAALDDETERCADPAAGADAAPSDAMRFAVTISLV
jgi:hypothetical protein